MYWIGDRRLHRFQIDQDRRRGRIERERLRRRRRHLGGGRQAGRGPGRIAAVQDLDLRIAEIAQQHVAAAGLAEAGVHRLLVDHRGLVAGQAGGAERGGELLAHRRDAVGRRGGEIGEDVVDVDGAGKVAGGIGRRDRGCRSRTVARRRDHVGEFGGRNENFLSHASLLCASLNVGWEVSGTGRRPVSRRRRPRRRCASRVARAI